MELELWHILLLYVVGLGLLIAECFLPGAVMGLVGGAALLTSIFLGFGEHWGIGTGQIVVTLVVIPAAFVAGMKRVAHRTSLGDSDSFAKDYEGYLDREGEARTDLRPAGLVEIDGKKLDVVTAGEMIEEGRRVRVVKVEGNRIVVRAI